jgi:hypothetical protein
MRPLLRPGTHVLRRADGSVQLGLDPGQAVVLDGADLAALEEAVPRTAVAGARYGDMSSIDA